MRVKNRRGKRSSMVAKYTATIRKHHGYSSTVPQKFFLYSGHQGKEMAYIKALKKSGYRPSIQDRMRGIKFVLFDMDGGTRTGRLERYHKRGVPIFLSPHAAS